MSKHTYGFPTDKDKVEAAEEALVKTEAVTHQKRTPAWDVSIQETEAHAAAGEYCIVVRTPE